jgi:hypothetical protein
VFKVSINPEKRLIEIKLIGLLSVSEIDDLRLEVAATLLRHGLRPRGFVALLDHSECPIQPQEVHEALVRFGKDPAILPGRLAICSGGAASRMQSRRGEAPCPRRLFNRKSEAMAWLLDESDRFTTGAKAPSASAVVQNRSW